MGEQYVGIDPHRRRSVIVRMTAEGEVLEIVQVDNDPVALSLALAKAGPDPEVVMEATYGWYWAADLVLRSASPDLAEQLELGRRTEAHRRHRATGN